MNRLNIIKPSAKADAEHEIDDFISKLIQAVDMVSQSDSYQKNQAAH